MRAPLWWGGNGTGAWHTGVMTTPPDRNAPSPYLSGMTDDEWEEYLDYEESRANAFLCEQGEDDQ